MVNNKKEEKINDHDDDNDKEKITRGRCGRGG
jgi:hypothetical protein